MARNKKSMNTELKFYFKDKINFSFVTLFNTLIVTKDDKVYEFDRFPNDNKNSLIVLSVEESDIHRFIEKAVKPELCGKKVKKFGISVHMNYALTEEGYVYCWVSNKNLQHYKEMNDIESQYKPSIIEYFKNRNIRAKDIFCGDYYTLVLTNDNKVYAFWDENQRIDNMLTKNVNIPEPYLLKDFGHKTIINITCGASHFLALTECGRVYSWGTNRMGECGRKGKEYYSKPKELIVKENRKIVSFKSICCNREQSMLLSSDGYVYAFGRNYDGELGIGSVGNQFEPKKVLNIKTIESIAGNPFKWVLMAKSENSFYFWGNFHTKENSSYIKEPNESTEFNSFNEIFNKYLNIDCFPNINGLMSRPDDNYINNFYDNIYFDKTWIGKGGYGEVFKVRNKTIPDIISVIKKIPLEKNFEYEFLNEWELFEKLKTLKNDRVVNYYNAWLENDYKYNENGEKVIFKNNVILNIAMEFCDKNLREIMNEINSDSNFVNPNTNTLTLLGYYIASQIFIEILKGVNVLHKNTPQLIHRDLKPENIFVKLDEKSRVIVKIGDLGLVTIHSFGQIHSIDVCRDLYIAPEMENCVTGNEYKSRYDYRADIYMLGWTVIQLFRFDEILGDKIKFTHKSFDDILQKVMEPNRIQSDECLLENKYKHLQNILRKIMEPNPDHRIDNIGLIIDSQHSWALNLTEFDINKELNKVSNSIPKANTYVYQMCRKYYLNSFEDNFVRNNWYLSEYKDEEYLGEGEFGQVFRVTNIWNNNMFAIKKLKLLRDISLEELDKAIKSIIEYKYQYNIDRNLQFSDYWIEKNINNENILYILMELSDISFSNFIKEFEKCPELSNKYLQPMGYYMACKILVDFIENISYLLKKGYHFRYSFGNILFKINENSYNLLKLGDVNIESIYKYSEPLRKQVITTGKLRKLRKKSVTEEKRSKVDISGLNKLFHNIIYSLFRISPESKTEIPDLEIHASKYRELKNILNQMLQNSDNIDLNEIINTRKLWELKAKHFDSKSVLRKIMDSPNYDSSIIYKLLRKYLIIDYYRFGKVKNTAEIIDKNCYPMFNNRRGMCLIINCLEREEQNFIYKDIFKELHFEVKYYNCLSGKQIVSKLESISEDINLDSDQALVLIIISEGFEEEINGFNKDLDKTIKTLKISKILEIFGNNKNQFIKSMPKLVFIYCLTKKLNRKNGIQNIHQNLENNINDSSNEKCENSSIQALKTIEKELAEKNRNTYICYVCSEEKVNQFSRILYFSLSLSNSISDLAHKQDLVPIIENSLEYMRIFSENKQLFDFEIRVKNLEKQLFFNPGFVQKKLDQESD